MNMQPKHHKTEPWSESGNGFPCPKAVQKKPKNHKLRTWLRKFALDPFIYGMHLTEEVSVYSLFFLTE